MAIAARPRIAVRAMTLADVSRVRQIERGAYGEHRPNTPFERELRNGLAQYLVAEDVTAAAGAGVGGWRARVQRLLGGGESASRVMGFAGAWFTHDQLHVVTVAVDPARQGEGIGQALLLACYELAFEAELATVALEVRISNARAQLLYERLGFERVGRLRAYYSNNGEDAVVMVTPEITSAEFQRRLEAVRAELDEDAGG